MKIRTQDAIRMAGTQEKLAALLNVTRSAVSQWGEHMPPLRVYELKAIKPRWVAAMLRSGANGQAGR